MQQDRRWVSIAGGVVSSGVLVDRVLSQWDAAGRLVEVLSDDDGDRDADTRVRLGYDEAGLRTERTQEALAAVAPVPVGVSIAVGAVSSSLATRFLWDQTLPFGQVLAEFASTAVAAIQSRYVIGNALIAQERMGAGGTLVAAYYLQDGHSGVRALVGPGTSSGGGAGAYLAAGELTDTYVYDAFGVLSAQTHSGTTATPNAHLYRAEYFDAALGQYDLRARHYDASPGRFTSVDPFAGSLTTPHTLHRYAYTHNDPLNFADPSGRFEGLAGTIAVAGLQSGLVSMAIGAPFRALKAADDFAAGAELDSVLWEAAVGLFWDGAIGAVLGGAGAGLARGFAALSRVGPIGRTLEQIRAARPAASVWNIANPFARGNRIHDTILGRAPTLPHWFHGIDDFANGVATSIKSLDLTAATYHTAGSLTRKLAQYADDLARFAGDARGGYGVLSNEIHSRALLLVFERGALSAEQAIALRAFQSQVAVQWPSIKVVTEFIL